jgi:hypothetical protein
VSADRDHPLTDRGTDRPCWGVVHGRRATREGARAGAPERRLMLAVLMDAVHRCRCRRSNVREGGPGWRVEDAWLRSEDRTWPFSFASICDYLGLDSTYLRHRLLRRTHEPSAVPAHQERSG